MGYTRHHCIVVSSCWEQAIAKAHEEAKRVFAAVGRLRRLALVSPLSEECANGFRSFCVFPDGSNEDWPESNAADACRDEFLAWLESQVEEEEEEAHCAFEFGKRECGWGYVEGKSEVSPPGAVAASHSCDKTIDGPNGCRAHGQMYTDAGEVAIHPHRFGGFSNRPRRKVSMLDWVEVEFADCDGAPARILASSSYPEARTALSTLIAIANHRDAARRPGTPEDPSFRAVSRLATGIALENAATRAAGSVTDRSDDDPPPGLNTPLEIHGNEFSSETLALAALARRHGGSVTIQRAELSAPPKGMAIWRQRYGGLLVVVNEEKGGDSQ